MDISEEAYRWVRENEKAVIARFIGDTPSVDNPGIVFYGRITRIRQDGIFKIVHRRFK